MNKIAILTVTAIVVTATGILGTFTMSGTAFAQENKDDPGASGFAPGQSETPNEDAPGAQGPHCIGCAKEVTPGQQGLKEGIIGPD